jgi:hypothetical protein
MPKVALILLRVGQNVESWFDSHVGTFTVQLPSKAPRLR